MSDRPSWSFPPEEDLLASATDDIGALVPLGAASAAMSDLLVAISNENIATAAQEAAGGAALFSFRALRAAAVLVAAGHTSETWGHIRRLAEFAELCRRVRGPGGEAYAAEWLLHRKSTSKLLDRDVNAALSQGAHAHAGHLATLSEAGEAADPWPRRHGVWDLLVPVSAAQLGHSIIEEAEAVFGLEPSRSRLVGQHLGLWQEAARQTAAELGLDLDDSAGLH